VATGELHAADGSSIGAAMRALPFGWATPVTAAAQRRELTVRLSRTPHGAPEAIISARVVAEMATWAIQQRPIDAVVAAGVREAEDVARPYAVHPATSNSSGKPPWELATQHGRADAQCPGTVASVVHVPREAEGLATAMKCRHA
jgi:ADP-ribosylglycohydrolase